MPDAELAITRNPTSVILRVLFIFWNKFETRSTAHKEKAIRQRYACQHLRDLSFAVKWND
jgi:hypothetical protein